MKERVPPEDCARMEDIRHGIDTLDQHIVTLLAERMRYIEAAARVKQQRDLVRDEARKAAVIANACRTAEASGLDTNLVEDLYELLVERSIAHEFERFDENTSR